MRCTTSCHIIIPDHKSLHHIISHHITQPTPHHTTPPISTQQHTSLAHMSNVAAAVMKRAREVMQHQCPPSDTLPLYYR